MLPFIQEIHMTYGDKIINLIKQCAYQILVLPEVKKSTTDFFHTAFSNTVDSTIILVNKNFPRQSIVERSVQGPIVDFLKNSKSDIINNLDSTVSSWYDSLTNSLNTTTNSASSQNNQISKSNFDSFSVYNNSNIDYLGYLKHPYMYSKVVANDENPLFKESKDNPEIFNFIVDAKKLIDNGNNSKWTINATKLP